MPSIPFTPEIALDVDAAPRVVPIKGQIPHLSYPFSLKDLYGTIPSLDPLAAYNRIREQFAQLNQLLHERAHLRPSFSLPPVDRPDEVLAVLGILLDPTSHYTDGLWTHLAIPRPARQHLFDLQDPRPFPLRRASTRKLLHTLVWIDTNVKINVERVASRCSLQPEAVFQIVEAALTIYSLLIKQQDYWLARSINFNYSMFLQDRILNLIFGDALYLADETWRSRGSISNRIALDLLKGFRPLSPRQLCVGSIFMGVIWTSDESLQNAFVSNPDEMLGNIDAQLRSAQTRLVVDDIDASLREWAAPEGVRLVVILDDNGESVFDMALFQQILRDIDTLTITFVVNRFPVSNNISEATFRLLLRDEFFSDLTTHIIGGRVTLSFEEQSFRSFEMAHLTSETRHYVRESSGVYVKGANFFETFHVLNKVVYYVFTVYGEMSTILTGYPEGSGLFVRIPAGQPAFVYEGPSMVVALRDLVEAQSAAGK